VNSHRRLARGIGYIRLRAVHAQVLRGILAAALRSIGADKGLKGLVLDLRFNPGGLLNEAEAIADLFLADGVIVSTKGRAYPRRSREPRAPAPCPTSPSPARRRVRAHRPATRCSRGDFAETTAQGRRRHRSFGKGSVQTDGTAQRQRQRAQDHRAGLLPAQWSKHHSQG
jgi:carboxyl-terminal processing protease